MEKNKQLSLQNFPQSLKVLCFCYLLTYTIGYSVALLQVYDRSHYNMQKVVEYYRGDGKSEEESIMPPQSFTSILSVTHVHTLSQPIMLALLALIYVFSSTPERLKSIIIVLAFTGTIISNSAGWLLRYVSPSAVYLFPLSQSFIFIASAFMLITSARHLCCSSKK